MNNNQLHQQEVNEGVDSHISRFDELDMMFDEISNQKEIIKLTPTSSIEDKRMMYKLLAKQQLILQMMFWLDGGLDEEFIIDRQRLCEFDIDEYCDSMIACPDHFLQSVYSLYRLVEEAKDSNSYPESILLHIDEQIRIFLRVMNYLKILNVEVNNP